MSIVPYGTENGVGHEPVAAVNVQPRRTLHRLRQVRQQQQISLRTVARRLNISLTDAHAQEEATADLPLSLLYQWQEILEVPASELLDEAELRLSTPVKQRAELIRLMKTAATMMEVAESARMKRLVRTLMDQLVEIMPELKDVGPWHASGSQRALDDLGRITERLVDDTLLSG